jgi:TolA-binding protein
MNEKKNRLFREGYDAYQSRDYKLAVQKLWLYAHQLPHEINHEPFYWISKCHVQLNDLDSAVDALKTYVRGCGDLHGANVLKEIGLELREQGHFEHGKTVLMMAVELNPKIGLTTLLKSI